MKIKVQIILEELRNLESAKGSGDITEEKINEICKAHGVGFEEFRSSILEMLADEAGISADELESLSFEEISEVDLDKISGGAGLPGGVKRGAASLMALLNMGNIASSYATATNPGRVRRSSEVTAARRYETDGNDDEDIEEKQTGISKEALKKWAKRLGIPVAAAALIFSGYMIKRRDGSVKDKGASSSGDTRKRLPHGQKVNFESQPTWTFLNKDSSAPIAARIGRDDGPTKFFVHLSNLDKPDTFYLRIVGSADDNKTVLISDAVWCADENKKIADHTAGEDIIKKWEGTTAYVYENIQDLSKDGIIDRLKKFYKNIKVVSTVAVPTRPTPRATGATSTTPHSFGLNSDSAATTKFADEIYEFEHPLGGTKNNEIKASKITRLALQLSPGDFDTKQKEMTDISKKLLDSKKKSDYYNNIQKNTWQCTFASAILPQHRAIFDVFGLHKNFDDLALGVIGTENMDYYQKEDYLCGGMKSESGSPGQHHGAALPSGRTSGRYARLFRDKKGKLHALQKTPYDVLNARAGMILNLTLKTLTKNGTCPIYPNLLNTIINNKKIINQLTDKLQNMNAYHQCSGDVFNQMLETKSVVSMDRLLDPLVAKNDKEKLNIMWDSLSTLSDTKKPDTAFRNLMNNYDAGGVENFLKTCVGNNFVKVIEKSRSEKAVKWKIPIQTLRLLVNSFNSTGSADVASVSAELQKDAALVESYMRAASDSTLVNFNVPGLGSQEDAKAGTNTTVFSIFGGNKAAIDEYALKGNTSNKGCIIEIPKECVSYVSPYAILLDANNFVRDVVIESKSPGPHAVIDKSGNGIDKTIKTGLTGCDIDIDTTGGLIAFADSPYIGKDSWASNGKDKCIANNPVSSDRQISQMLRSRKLDPRNKACATVLAIYMFCQYMILHKGQAPKSAQEVLDSNYKEVGSHACMEGHSPGEIPLGGGGVERVLMIGYTDTDKVVQRARAEGLKVNCIDQTPATYDAYVKAFNACK